MPSVQPGTLEYPLWAKALPWVGGLGTPSLVVFALVSSGRMPLHRIYTAFPLAAFTMLIASPLAIGFWREHHCFDRDTVTYGPAWGRQRTLRWDMVRSLRWRPSYQWIDIKDGSGSVFHFSTLLQGRAGFAKMALQRIPAAVLAEHAAETRLLENMASRAASTPPTGA